MRGDDGCECRDPGFCPILGVFRVGHLHDLCALKGKYAGQKDLRDRYWESWKRDYLGTGDQKRKELPVLQNGLDCFWVGGAIRLEDGRAKTEDCHSCGEKSKGVVERLVVYRCGCPLVGETTLKKCQRCKFFRKKS